MTTMPRRHRHARRCVVALAVMACASTPVAAQQSESAPRPNWVPHYPPDLGASITPAERTAAMGTLEDIERILGQMPELARPRGFEVGKQVFGGSLPLGDHGVLSYTFFLWFYAPSKAVTGGEGVRCIQVAVNAADNQYRIERERGDAIPGATVVYGGLRWDTPTADRREAYVILTPGVASPWAPVTREQYLQRMIENAEGKNGEAESAAKAALQKTTYQTWIEEAAGRKKARDAAVASLVRAQGRAAAEEFRKSQEASEREITEQYKGMEAEERKQNQLFLANRQGDALRAQLTALTPAERAAPATVSYSGEPVAPDHPEAHRVLQSDPEFWRVRRSRAEVHSLTVKFSPSMTCADPNVRDALEKAYRGLDWAALKRLVDTQP
jgi:hypothetical protein